MAGLFMSKRELQDGSTAVADDNYLRESILDSTERVVAGYAPIMPSFRGQISEEQLMNLIAYIKSLREPEQQRKAQ
jgi:cytochrome c oxidase subunit 2